MNPTYVVTTGRLCAELCRRIHDRTAAETHEETSQAVYLMRGAGHESVSVLLLSHMEGSRPRLVSSTTGRANGRCQPCAAPYISGQACSWCGQPLDVAA